ncbi:MAG: hypothetical protein K2F85_04785, partial [Helicobacter sp.]|nr:hypothetical protein [Helicobacter sp.]
PQRMRQRYAYGSNIAAVRCGWENRISEQWRIKDCNLQSGAVLWLRHSFARAFSGDSEARFYSHTTAKPKTPCDSTMEREMLYQP